MRDKLREVKEIFDKLAKVSSIKSKEVILKQNEDNELFKSCLKFLLDDNITTGLDTKKLAKKIPLLNTNIDLDIRHMFSYIQGNNTGTDENIAYVKTYINYFDDDMKDFLWKLFSKKLKCGASTKIVNKVYKGFIKEFNIMLGSKFDFNKVPSGTKYITEKFDGLRCFCIIKDGKITLKSRQNKVFEGLVDIETSIAALGLDNTCLDGELLSIGSSYEDVYKDTTKKVNNKNKVKTGVKYQIFDIIPLEEFENEKGKLTYSERRKMLDKIPESEYIKITPLLYVGDSMDMIMQILNKYREQGAEGLMCNLDKPYEFKRSKTLLKMKVMSTCDLRVIGFEEGEGRLEGTLGKITCDYKGFKLGVGSGFSDNIRTEIWNNQDKYLGRIAEIKYFEETHNDKGELSLRFPVFVEFRDKNEVSYD